jgi:peptide/nickel transport system permease protein
MTVSALNSPTPALELSEADERWVVSNPHAARNARFSRLGRSFLSVSVGVPTLIFLLIVLGCYVGPFVFNVPSPIVGDLGNSLTGLGAKNHLLGTNELGNDMLSRLMYGGRVSIVVGFGATLLGFVIGVLLGMVAGFFGGENHRVARLVETLILRVFDTLLAFPSTILALVIAQYLGPSVRNSIIAISVSGISRFGRLAWSQTMHLRHRDYVTASRSDGAGAGRIIRGHLLPNVLPSLIGFSLFTVGTSMMVEAGLSFLGLGVPQPQPSWGNMISSGNGYLSTNPSLVLLPGVALVLMVLALNLMADGIRDRMAVDR